MSQAPSHHSKALSRLRPSSTQSVRRPRNSESARTVVAVVVVQFVDAIAPGSFLCALGDKRVDDILKVEQASALLYTAAKHQGQCHEPWDDRMDWQYIGTSGILDSRISSGQSDTVGMKASLNLPSPCLCYSTVGSTSTWTWLQYLFPPDWSMETTIAYLNEHLLGWETW
ncbi:hypothetical protein K458DRAFT_434611 [Lentithecium fluviatile CBS 122367]|uniref:Uncharacterized protein n=1 Tax=Lentithecium fluviatile CBS 122367 TaxID=1168545 RepID=A0A6G1IPU7_9PLEO|nr:hypothetical protein K458DRAFT_434611 [Lentithecium fluviatile CBS 122367]